MPPSSVSSGFNWLLVGTNDRYEVIAELRRAELEDLIAELAHDIICGCFPKEEGESLNEWATNLAATLNYTEDCDARLDHTDIEGAYAVAALTMAKVINRGFDYHDPRTGTTITV